MATILTPATSGVFPESKKSGLPSPSLIHAYPAPISSTVKSTGVPETTTEVASTVPSTVPWSPEMGHTGYATTTEYEEPSSTMMSLLGSLSGMSSTEKENYLQAMREKLIERLYRYETMIQRGFGEQMDETAQAEYATLKSNLTDIQTYISDPEYAKSVEEYADWKSQYAHGTWEYWAGQKWPEEEIEVMVEPGPVMRGETIPAV